MGRGSPKERGLPPSEGFSIPGDEGDGEPYSGKCYTETIT